MNGQSLCNPSQCFEEIAGGLQLLRLCNPILDGAVFLLFDDQAVDALRRGMGRVQSERLIGQRFSSQPVGFENGMRVLDEGIGQNGAGERIVLVQFVGLAQQLKRFGGLLVGEQFLAFGDQTVGFVLALDALLGALRQVGQIRIIIIGEFGGSGSQQIEGARIVARMQRAVDLLHEPRFRLGEDLLVDFFLQAL